MKLYLNTSTSKCILKLDDKVYEAELGHEMAEKLLGFIKEKLAENNQTFDNITELEFMSGPGSFTGLRIGASVINTIADYLGIPIKDQNGDLHQLILPEYGRPANITTQKK